MRKKYSVLNTISVLITTFSIFGIVYIWYEDKTQTIEPLPISVSHTEILTQTSTTIKVVIPDTSSSSVQKDGVFPKTFLLSLPFTSQAPEKNWDQPWQDACEEAAVLMVNAYYSDKTLDVTTAKEEILKMVEWEETQKGWGRSIEIEKIQDIFNEYLKYSSTKKTVSIIENPTVDQIKQFVVKGQPVLVVADGKVLPNPHFRNGGPQYHALVIKGYTETEFITNDPGTQFGENFKYTYDDLLDSIRDWNEGDVKNGKQAVLVIEE